MKFWSGDDVRRGNQAVVEKLHRPEFETQICLLAAV